jgi:hypothetical protein
VTKNVDHHGRGSSLDNAAGGWVGRSQIRAGDLTTQHRDPMRQHDNLDLVGTLAPHTEREQLQNGRTITYSNDKITTDSIPEPGHPRSHKTARQAP